MTPSKSDLEMLYTQQGLSVSAIAHRMHCSEGKVNYWLSKFGIKKRSISEALYQKWNPAGDPFSPPRIKTRRDAFMYGMGVGLYWGEGNRSNKTSVRLGNTDPKLIKAFLVFLTEVYHIHTNKLRFGLQIFSDMSPARSLRFWQQHLSVSPAQFQKVVVTPARSLGTYRKKTQHGVLTVYFNNKRLRDIICRTIEHIDGVVPK